MSRRKGQVEKSMPQCWNGRVTFCWPQIDLFFYVDQLQNEKLTALPDPVVDRRGSSVIFKRGVFGKLQLGELV